MIGIIFLVVGLGLVGMGFYTFFTISGSGAAESAASFGMNLGGTLLLPSILLWVIGGMMVLAGVVSLMKGKARQGELRQIAAVGMEADGIVTFVDRNYSVLVNNRPVYSVVEYRYKDMMGREFVGRASNLNTDFVIRSGWRVGTPIKVRFMPDDPTKSAIVAAELVAR